MACTEPHRNSVFNTDFDSKLFFNDIPGYLGYYEPMVLHAILEPFANVETVGVEMGSLHGKSSYTIAKTIDPGILYCIDTWGDFNTHDPQYDVFIHGNCFPKQGMKNTLEFFLENVKECSNIKPIKGWSPECVIDWSIPIDFVFIDGLHENPSDRENIDFWITKIKHGGLLIGHDYYKEGPYPDVRENIKYLEQHLNQKVKNPKKSTIWYFQI